MTRSGRSFMALFRWGTALAVLLLADGPLSAAADRHGKPPVPRQQEWLAQPLGERYPQIPAQVWEWIDQANALEAKGDYGMAATVWQQVLAWREKAQGPDHPDTAASLNNLGLLYIKERAFSKAEPLLLRALAIRTKILGPDHPFTALSLNNLAWLYANQGSHAKAELLYLRALAIAEKALGPEHPGLALGLNNLGLLYSSQGDYAKAEPLYLRALAIREKGMGSDPLDTATSLNSLGLLYRDLGAYTKAESLLLRALAIREKAFGPYPLATAISLSSLGLLYDDLGAYAKAESLLLRALSIREKVQGPDHNETATSLNNLATLYISQGAYAKAEPLLRRCLAIKQKVLGDDHPDTATSLNNLAELYKNQGAFAKTEPFYLRALAINEKVLGPDHPSTATSLNNLALLYRSQGAYGKAEPLLLRALAIREKALGLDSVDTAASLINLAALYDNQGAFAKAEPLYLRALAINEKVLGPGHPITATSLNNLAVLYDNQGASAKAEPLHRRALAIREKALGPDHPDTAASLNNLAELLRLQGSGAKAEPLFLRSLAIFEKALGPDHPTTALSLNNLAKLYLSQGADAKAEPLLRRGIGSQSLFLQQEAPLLPQARRQEQIKALGNVWEIPYSLVANAPGGASLALFTRLNRHGLLQDIERRQAQLGRGSPAQQILVSQLTALTARLADVNLSDPQRQTLQQERDRLEQELYRQLPALTPRLVDPAQVAAALPADGVLFEFQRFRPYDARQPEARSWGEARYLAMLLFPDGSTRAVDLGPAAATDPLIQQALAESLARNRPAGPFWARVSQKVLGPLMQQLVGRRRWFVSPDGELSRIPFTALPAPSQDPSGAEADSAPTLGQRVQLRIVTSGRDLLSQRSPGPGGQRALVLAAPDFGGPGGAWQPLPATAAEGRWIAERLGASLYQGAAATTGVLQQARGPRVLHIASHGFFSDPNAQLPQASPASSSDPLLNSGIVLAGANRSWLSGQGAATSTADDDGYLTAKEAAQLQLDGTELVVLSACDTASGTLQTGEGVYGLQRALTVAGARSTLLSLWKVDDDATAAFMQRYVALLKQGRGRMDALATVQQEFRSNPPDPDWADHKFWAAWQLTGDGGPIPGL
ncbi:CHAT domain-containing tetratricopeptide repeat protein [Cyanobium gracile]|uniref:CHAT domain-containing tetratricopeptide repeat protein n=1 Tax=Cyanobium gracile UHCC 0281 TaxID=3110309 RepID=A0ABU5SST3_9CYAN|nr:CHAT domain-containing tetratricopeptide repeat protein [Cyanobium gracile]MEA5441591.1 CHAT domain-containing tetratricopeptide repeat protein [Cyanobium gracile UHCC 0281]